MRHIRAIASVLSRACDACTRRRRSQCRRTYRVCLRAPLALHHATQVYTDIDTADPVMTSTITPWPPFDNLKWFDIAFEFKSGISKLIEVRQWSPGQRGCAGACISFSFFSSHAVAPQRFNLQEITKVPTAVNFEKEFIKPFSARLEKRIVKDAVRSKAFRARCGFRAR